jgi:hypothetical protein
MTCLSVCASRWSISIIIIMLPGADNVSTKACHRRDIYQSPRKLMILSQGLFLFCWEIRVAHNY